MRKQKQSEEDDYRHDDENGGKKEGKLELYKCGQPSCAKFYHSYTAFYNHCKKSHGGQFPQQSIHNGKIFEGPSKNRGRPRIKKNQTKDQAQIQSMKRENELIQFLGTLKSKKGEQLIVYVENPIQRLEAAVIIVLEWLDRGKQDNQSRVRYLKQLEQFNKLVASNDLPEFYDPIEADLYRDSLDSYNFSSIYNFMISPSKREKFQIKFEGTDLLYRIHCVWLARILSEKLLAQVIYTVLQIQFDVQNVKEKELLFGRTEKFRQITEKYFQCFIGQHAELEKDV